MKIAVGADQKIPIVESVIQYLKATGHEVVWFGPEDQATAPWPKVAKQVAKQIVQHQADEGILLCWTGTGVSIAANKVKGVRAALCEDAYTAKGARLWNNANILCLSLRKLSPPIAEEILQTWFATSYIPNANDDACIAEVE